MRLIRFVLVLIGLWLTVVSAAQAQHSARLMNSSCGCNACGQDPCCPPLLPCLTEPIHQALSSLFCCPGLNARHDIYRAALYRNDFGKCSKYVPIYSPRKCGCGGAIPGCQHCGTGAAIQGEEVIETQEVPESMPQEPTPAVEPETPVVEPETPAVEPETPPMPAEAVPPQTTRNNSQQRPGRATIQRSSRTARSTSNRDRVAQAQVGDETPSPVARTAAQQSAGGSSLIQRALLLQTPTTRPANSLR